MPARTAGFAVLAYEGLGLKRSGCPWTAPAAAGADRNAGEMPSQQHKRKAVSDSHLIELAILLTCSTDLLIFASQTAITRSTW